MVRKEDLQIPFPLSCLTNVQDFCKPEHFSLTGFNHKTGVFAMTVVFSVVKFGLYCTAK